MDTGRPESRYRAQQGDLMRIPSPFGGSLKNMGSSFRGLPAAMGFDRFQGGRKFHGEDGD
jgi:hypothetical protein